MHVRNVNGHAGGRVNAVVVYHALHIFGVFGGTGALGQSVIVVLALARLARLEAGRSSNTAQPGGASRIRIVAVGNAMARATMTLAAD